jgi:hypothetical protein
MTGSPSLRVRAVALELALAEERACTNPTMDGYPLTFWLEMSI